MKRELDRNKKNKNCVNKEEEKLECLCEKL